jgi:hypothetical protein
MSIKRGTKNFNYGTQLQGNPILLTSYLYNFTNWINCKTHPLKLIAVPDPNPEIYTMRMNNEAMTQGGWVYNVVNSADWVPENYFNSNFERFQ